MIFNAEASVKNCWCLYSCVSMCAAKAVAEQRIARNKAPINPSRLVRHLCPINPFARWEKIRFFTNEKFPIHTRISL